jgi:aspartyl-tRNA(Asn)/glutamyl-tRNA(Gln) amidotransferase subunit C
MISKEEIKKMADLARIQIEDGEIESLRGEMDAILDYVKLVQQFHSDEALRKVGAEEELESGMLRNVMRKDENPIEPEKHSKELIAEFPDSENNYLKVKKIL